MQILKFKDGKEFKLSLDAGATADLFLARTEIDLLEPMEHLEELYEGSKRTRKVRDWVWAILQDDAEKAGLTDKLAFFSQLTPVEVKEAWLEELVNFIPQVDPEAMQTWENASMADQTKAEIEASDEYRAAIRESVQQEMDQGIKEMAKQLAATTTLPSESGPTSELVTSESISTRKPSAPLT